MRKIYLAIIAMTLASVSAMAQKIADKELVGAWLMESIKYDGESEIVLGDDYVQFKYFGPDGEYACAELVITTDGHVSVHPHEYGKYTFRNGLYSEMGRRITTDGVVLESPTRFRGRWKNRTDYWRKATTMPKAVINDIVQRCKAHQAPDAEMEALMKKYCFK